MNVNTSCARHRHVVALVNAGSRSSLLHHVRLLGHIVAIITARPVVVLITARPVVMLITARPVVVHNTGRPVVVLITALPVVVHNTVRPVVFLNTARPVVVSRYIAITTLLRSSRYGPSMEQSSPAGVMGLAVYGCRYQTETVGGSICM